MLRLAYYSTRFNLHVLLCLLLCFLISGKINAATTTKTYSIVLASAAGNNLKWNYSKNQQFSGRSFYIEKLKIKDTAWERLNVGFYNSRKQASSALKKVRTIYPGAWVIKTPPNANKHIIYTAPKGFKGSIHKNTSSLSEKQLNSLMERALRDLKNKKYSSAIRYLNALVNAGNHRYSSQALELLGLARQRKGQNSHAVIIYERYLKLYPDNKGSVRVRQRLTGLLTAASEPRKKVLMMSDVEHINEITTFGSLSQFYRSNTAKIDGAASIKTLSQFITFVDVRTTHRTNNFDHRYQFTSDHIFDFINDDEESEFRFIETYYELSYRKTGTSGIIGRQALRIGGLLNRFDGLSLGYQFTPDIRLNILGGFPVEIDNKSSINENKQFYGLIFETGTFLKNWNMNLFYFDQTHNGFDDRTSLGTEVYYHDNRQSFFGMIDYDLLFKEINILQFNGNMFFEQGRNIFVNAFMRTAPILSTSNALIGQEETSLEELLAQNPSLNIEQVYQLANDRTANNQTITTGASQRFSLNYQASADLTVSQMDSTPASGGVPATEKVGPNYFISLQLVGNDVLFDRDTGVLGLRYSNTEPSTTFSFIANTRLPITLNWRINPRLQYDIRDLTDNRSQTKLRALIRTDYIYRNKVRFDFEFGYDTTDSSANDATLANDNLFFTLGYHWNF